MVWLLVLLMVAIMGTVYAFFGRGADYVDLTTAPVLPQGTIEAAVISDRPIGNVAVSANGRIFYTLHPESNSEPLISMIGSLFHFQTSGRKPIFSHRRVSQLMPKTAFGSLTLGASAPANRA